MAAGKSTVGKRLAVRLGYEFRDTDGMIEERAGLAVRTIFERHGEAHLRQLEREALRAVAGLERVVVATGGGMLTEAANRRLLSLSGVSFWLSCPFDILESRLGRSSETRPLALRGNRLAELFGQREAFYSAADFTVDASLDTDRVVEQLVELIRGRA